MGACGLIEAQSSVVTATKLSPCKFSRRPNLRSTRSGSLPVVDHTWVVYISWAATSACAFVGIYGVRSSGRNDMASEGWKGRSFCTPIIFRAWPSVKFPTPTRRILMLATPWQAWRESNVTPRIQARGGVILSRLSSTIPRYSNILVTVKFSAAGRGKVTYISVHTQNKTCK